MKYEQYLLIKVICKAVFFISKMVQRRNQMIIRTVGQQQRQVEIPQLHHVQPESETSNQSRNLASISNEESVGMDPPALDPYDDFHNDIPEHTASNQMEQELLPCELWNIQPLNSRNERKQVFIIQDPMDKRSKRNSVFAMVLVQSVRFSQSSRIMTHCSLCIDCDNLSIINGCNVLDPDPDLQERYFNGCEHIKLTKVSPSKLTNKMGQLFGTNAAM